MKLLVAKVNDLLLAGVLLGSTSWRVRENGHRQLQCGLVQSLEFLKAVQGTHTVFPLSEQQQG